MIALAMILAIWIAIRVTFVAVEEGAIPEQMALRESLTVALAAANGPPARSASGAELDDLAEGRAGRPFPASGAGTEPSSAARQKGAWPEDAGPEDARSKSARPKSARPKSARQSPFVATAPAATGHPETGRDNSSASANSPAPNGFAAIRSSPPSQTSPRVARWSADGWVLVRGGQSGPALAAGAAAYGGSQMGAVLRYTLAPASKARPQLYLRVTAALSGTGREPEAAFGFAMRPVRRLPVAVLGEVRLQARSGGPARARPVVMAVSELPPLRLPLGSEAEVYAQAGWAGGQDPTAFFDAAAVAQRRVVKLAPGAELRLGGGFWSGGQRGAARLDIGPHIELRGMIGPPARRIGVRLAADWRFRAAGGAEPGSGPAITLAAGF